MSKLLIQLLFLLPIFLQAQTPSEKIQQIQAQQEPLKKRLSEFDKQIEILKLQALQTDLQKIGLPKLESGEQLINHSAISLVYSENFEQAKWVAHIITPEIITGKIHRTNDFRPDPKVATGTAVEKDYFLKTEYADKPTEYDGFGYDRGHLASSADFRWSPIALSESYFYSNMSPQLPEFNREIWAKLENTIRGYVYQNPDNPLYVVTGPLLKDNLPTIQRSTNQVAIPNAFWKVVIDPKQGRGIGFLFPHAASTNPIETFATTIDEIEKLTGIDFFHNLPDDQENQLESDSNKTPWFKDLQTGSVEPLTINTVPRKRSYPTTFAKKFINKSVEINVCGTVVGGRYSQKGNLLLNLDKKYPNQIFTIFVKKADLINFSYDPLELIGAQICSKGKIINQGGATMYLNNEKEIEVIRTAEKDAF